jgi:crotonobetainyl-CoA:carnitine CoA-transferase CaiB-like acyl-CoA transferase
MRHLDRDVHGLSANFVWVNRGKESVVLDIKSPGDIALIRRMLAKADVWIQNLGPGT